MLSVIVVDYNSIEKTLSYIKDLSGKMTAPGDIHYIIVDNYSEIADLETKADTLKLTGTDEFEGKKVKTYASQEESSVTYIAAGDNLGYAKGNNLGMRLSSKLFGDDYYLISNNDIEIPESFDFSIIKKKFDNITSIAVIGPKVVGTDGKPQSPNKKPSAFGNLVATYLSMATHDKFFKWDDVDYTDESKLCYRIMGSFMFLRASAMKEVGMFDENTFMFAEEMILSERMIRHGYLTYFFNDLTVIHAHGETIDKLADRSDPVKWSHDSVSYYFKKYRNTGGAMLLLGNITCNLYIKLYKLKKKSRIRK